jgi:hypothetical protein
MEEKRLSTGNRPPSFFCHSLESGNPVKSIDSGILLSQE